MTTAFVTDSTLGLSPAQALEQGLHLVLAQVIVDGRSYRDYQEISPEQIVAFMQAGKRLSTSHSPPSDFQNLYESLLNRYDRVLSVHAPAKLSGFVTTAQMVAKQFGNRVQVLDSFSTNAGMGYVLREAQRLLQTGVSWEGLEPAVAPFRAKLKSWVLPQSLEYLRRGGRISGLQFFIGSFLRLLPVLEFQEGLVKPVERVRSFHLGLVLLAQRLGQTFPAGARVTLAHAENPQALEQLGSMLRHEGVLLEGIRPAGAAVTVHAGPGTIALFAAPP